VISRSEADASGRVIAIGAFQRSLPSGGSPPGCHAAPETGLRSPRPSQREIEEYVMDQSLGTPRVTPTEVAEIAGELSESATAQILATGATAAELIEAITWMSSDDYLHRALHHAPAGIVATLCDIIEDERRPPDDPVRGPA
jgi:hypothetical protein